MTAATETLVRARVAVEGSPSRLTTQNGIERSRESPALVAFRTPTQRHYVERYRVGSRPVAMLCMEELTIAERANLWITTEEGNLTIEQIEQLHKGLVE
jgi:hypothetical protein